MWYFLFWQQQQERQQTLRSRPAITVQVKYENTPLFLWLGLPSTLISLDNSIISLPEFASTTIGHSTVVCSVTWLLIESEVGGELALKNRPHWFCHVKVPASIRTTWFKQQKYWSLYQNKVNSSLAAIQRPGHWADKRKMVYSWWPVIAAFFWISLEWCGQGTLNSFSQWNRLTYNRNLSVLFQVGQDKTLS